MYITKQVEDWNICSSNDHYFNLLVQGKCERCQHEFMEAMEDAALKHGERTEQEINAMAQSNGQ